MICLLSMSNKEKLARQLAFVLLAESGKLKRLLMAPSVSNPSPERPACQPKGGYRQQRSPVPARLRAQQTVWASDFY